MGLSGKRLYLISLVSPIVFLASTLGGIHSWQVLTGPGEESKFIYFLLGKGP